MSIVGLSLREAFDVLGRDETNFPANSMIAQYKQAFFDLRHSTDHQEPLYPGAREAILALGSHDDCLLGIATGKSQRGVRAVLDHHGLLPHFATIKTADDAPSKPHPGMILEAMREAGAERRDTLMIGDTSYDMEMACAAGVRAIGVAWGYHAVELLKQSGALHVAHNYPGLSGLIDACLFAGETV